MPVSDAVMKSLEGSGLTSIELKKFVICQKPDYSKGEFVNRDVNKPDPKNIFKSRLLSETFRTV